MLNFIFFSSVSTSINALATVTLEDFIKPYFTVSEEKLSYIAMGISKFIFGILLWKFMYKCYRILLRIAAMMISFFFNILICHVKKV